MRELDKTETGPAVAEPAGWKLVPLERLRADPLSSLDAYSKGFEEGGRVERERADFLEAENERLRATLEKIAGSHDERVGHCPTDMADVPDCSAEEAMNLARALLAEARDGE